MTPSQLDEIEQRAKANIGPWRIDIFHPGSHSVATRTVEESDKQKAAFREFILHAPADIPALLAEVRRLREALEPFASFVDAADPDGIWTDESSIGETFVRGVRKTITYGHLRNARRALTGAA